MLHVKKIIPFAMMSMMSFQTMAGQGDLFAADGIQIAIRGVGDESVPLPGDGSSCDPSVIRSNLSKVNGSGIFKDLKLTVTKTKAVFYDISYEDFLRAKNLHCEKAELLAHLVEHLEERVK